MKFLEAIALLGKVHKNDSNMYIESLADHTGDGSLTLAMKRKSSDKVAVLHEYYFIDDALLAFDFSECNFLYTGEDGKTTFYPFECADFLADDWECVIYDCDGEYDYSALKGKVNQTFAEFLLDRFDDVLLDYDGAIQKIKELYANEGSDKIQRIDIKAIFGNDNDSFFINRIDLAASNYQIKDWHIFDCLEKLGYGKDDVFEIEVELTNGKEFNLADLDV